MTRLIAVIAILLGVGFAQAGAQVDNSFQDKSVIRETQVGRTYCKNVPYAATRAPWTGDWTQAKAIRLAYPMADLWRARDSRVRGDITFLRGAYRSPGATSVTGTMGASGRGIGSVLRAKFRYNRSDGGLGCITITR